MIKEYEIFEIVRSDFKVTIYVADEHFIVALKVFTVPSFKYSRVRICRNYQPILEVPKDYLIDKNGNAIVFNFEETPVHFYKKSEISIEFGEVKIDLDEISIILKNLIKYLEYKELDIVGDHDEIQFIIEGLKEEGFDYITKMLDELKRDGQIE